MHLGRLLKQVFDIYIEHCPHCGGELKIIAAVTLGSKVIVNVLDHLGLPISHLRFAVPASLAVQPSDPGLLFAALSQLTRPCSLRNLRTLQRNMDEMDDNNLSGPNIYAG